MNIQTVDRNLAPSRVSGGMEFFDVRKAPFTLHGLYRPETPGLFRRCPSEVAEATSDCVAFLHTNTTGARVRFCTTSRKIAIRAEEPTICAMPHQALTGSSGFDMYLDGSFFKSFVPPIDYQGGFMPHFDISGGYGAEIDTFSAEAKQVTIFFPTYNDVAELYVGLEPGAELTEAEPYRNETPVVFYGSSITHGCSATHPGNTYPNLLSRWLDTDILNLAFSGSARGERAITDYIAGLKMSAFVLDYDHNAPDAEFLRKTHEPMFQRIREKQPELPIVIASKTDLHTEDQWQLRREIILDTYRHAVAAGDKNVYFVDGAKIFDLLDRSACTVDGCHPTDVGFFCMAKAFEPVLRNVLYNR